MPESETPESEAPESEASETGQQDAPPHPEDEEDGGSDKSHRLRRFLIALLVLLALVEGVYLVTGNVFLSTDWGPDLVNRKPEKFQASWDRAWTVLPGLVHVEDLHLRGKSRRARWSAHFDGAVLQIALPALLRRKFHLVSAHAEGTEVAVDIVPGEENSRDRPAHRRRGWRVVLNDLALGDLRSLRVGDLELAGDGTARGGAAFEIRGPLSFNLKRLGFDAARIVRVEDPDAHGDHAAGPPASAVADGGGGEPMATGVDLAARFRVDDFTASGQSGLDFVRQARAGLQLEAEVRTLAWLDPWLEKLDWFSLSGQGSLSVDTELESGALHPGGWVRFGGQRMVVDFFDFQASGDGRLELVVLEAGDPRILGSAASGPHTADPAASETGSSDRASSNRASSSSETSGAVDSGLDLSVAFGDYQVSRISDGAAVLDGESLDLDLVLNSASLFQRPDGAHGSFHLPEARITSLAVANAYLPPAAGLRLDGGAGTLSSEVEFDASPRCLESSEGCGSGWLKLAVADASGRYGDASFTGAVDLDAELPDLDLPLARFRLDGSRLDFRNATVERNGRKRAAEWWSRLELPYGAVSMAGGPAVDLHLRGAAQNSSPFLALLEQRYPKLGWFDSLVEVPDVAVDTRLSASGQTLHLSDFRLSGGEEDHVEALADLRIEKPRAGGATDEGAGRAAVEGVLFARYRALDATLALDQGERDWSIFRARHAYDRALEDFRAGRSPLP